MISLVYSLIYRASAIFRTILLKILSKILIFLMNISIVCASEYLHECFSFFKMKKEKNYSNNRSATVEIKYHLNILHN